MRTPILTSFALGLLTACEGSGDDSGLEDNEAPTVEITAPENGAELNQADGLRFRGTIGDDLTPLSELTAQWFIDDLDTISGTETRNGSTVGLDLTTVLEGGDYVLRLVVADEEGLTAEASVSFSLAESEPPTITWVLPANESSHGEGDRVEVEVSFYDPDEESVADLVVSWGGAAEGHPGAAGNPDKSGRIAFELENLDLGIQTLTVDVTDTSGAKTSDSVWFEVIAWDADGDGYDNEDLGGEDCDDDDVTIHPGVAEVCNSVDDDCDGRIDEDPQDDGRLYFGDDDEDGYGTPLYSVRACHAPSGYVDNDADCDDTDPEIKPGQPEVCDGVDNDCNGVADGSEAIDAVELFLDVDSDGYGGTGGSKWGCDEEDFYALESGDCNDANADINPGATEVCDLIDNDCNGTADGSDAVDATTWYEDADEDTYGAALTATNDCEQPDGWVEVAKDCDDADAEVNPDATETCDSVDNNCDGTVDEDTAADALTWYHDLDGDGHGDPDSTTLACSQPSNAVGDATDCDDTDALTSPSATEYCDGADDDCDGEVDEDTSADAATWYWDGDEDGYGRSDTTEVSCSQPTGYVSLDTDCDDADADVNPAAVEYCDDVDNDCDGTTDPDASVDAVDWYTDADGDGYGDPSSAVIETSCYGSSGLAADNTDCDDAVASTHPGADETCNSTDDDCDGTTDEDPTDGEYFTIDGDGDGFGEYDGWEWGCDGVDNDLDCDDGDPTEPHIVDGSSSTTSPSGTIDDPWLTIQDGLDSAGGCVAVYPGTYTEAIDFNGSDTMVRSVYGPGLTTIDASGYAEPVVTFESAETEDAILEGFTLTGGEGKVSETFVTEWDCTSVDHCLEFDTTYCGGGIYVNGASPTLRDLEIDDNDLPVASTTAVPATERDTEEHHTTSYGGGICLVNASVDVEDVHVTDNFADQGGGIWLDESSVVTWKTSTVESNSATDGAGLVVDGGSLSLENVLVVGNVASSYGGGLVISTGSADLTNVTLGLNSAGAVDGIYVEGTSSLDLTSVVLYGRGSGTGLQMDSSGTLVQVYSDVYGFSTRYSGVTDPTDSNGNIDEDPLFTDVSDDANYDNDDWTLSSSSPCVDAGDPDAVVQDTDGSANDMGCYGGPGGDWGR